MKKKFSSRQLMVLLGACLFQCAMIGVLINCSGVLFAQIRQELGFSMSKVSVYNTLKSVTTALAAASITAFFFKSNRARFLFINQIVTIGSFLMLAVGAEGPLWYASAVVCGLSGCVANVAVPMTLNQWFPDNGGTATGIAMAFSGIGGAICNPLCARLIGIVGWKWAIVVLGGVMMALTIPGLILMFRFEAPNPPVNTRRRVKGDGKGIDQLGTVVLVALVLIGGSLGVTLAMNMSIFVQSIGYTLSVGATVTTMIMIGNVGSKFIYGMLIDKLGVWKATMLGLLVEAAALLCYLLIPGKIGVLYVISLLYGFVYALSVVGISRCVVSAYGTESNRYLGIHTSIHSAVMAVASLSVGVLVDKFGSFKPVLYMILISVACSFTAALILLKKSAAKTAEV